MTGNESKFTVKRVSLLNIFIMRSVLITKTVQPRAKEKLIVNQSPYPADAGFLLLLK